MTVASVKSTIATLKPVDKTQCLVRMLAPDPRFGQLADRAEVELRTRDMQDEQELREGIRFAGERGLLTIDSGPREWQILLVDGLSPEDISRRIVNAAPLPTSVSLSGPSGIGKGTVASALQGVVPELDIWSNGDIFRFLTHMCLSSEVLSLKTPPVPSQVFEIADTLQYDQQTGVSAEVDGQKYRLGDINPGVLRTAELAGRVPQIARLTQGNVIQLTNQALSSRQPGRSLLIEGRRTTLDHLNSKVRIALAISDRHLLGARRVAHRIVTILEDQSDESSEQIWAVIDRLYR